MWKIVVGFILFAAISLFAIFKAGDKVDMGGEKHGTEATHAAPAAAAPASAPAAAASDAAAPAAAASAAAPAASAPAAAASK